MRSHGEIIHTPADERQSLPDTVSHQPFPPAADGLPLVKVCGLTRAADARLALELGASFLGLILTTNSPRHLPAPAAAELIRTIRSDHPEARFIGVFTAEAPGFIEEHFHSLGLLAVQIHGDVTALSELLPRERIIPALAIKDQSEADRIAALHPGYATVLADAFSPDRVGGTGKVFNHRLVQPLFPDRRLLVAGGLNPDNIESLHRQLGPGPYPYAYDISSGLEESPGIKSHGKMRLFFERLHAMKP